MDRMKNGDYRLHPLKCGFTKSPMESRCKKDQNVTELLNTYKTKTRYYE